MIKEQGVVVKLDAAFAFVETSVKSTCSSCAAKSNCGTSAVASAVAGKTVVNKVKNDLGAKVGDTVEIGIAEETILTGAFYLYILPLVTAMLAAFVTQYGLSKVIAVTEVGIIGATFIGGAIGFKYAKYKLDKGSEQELLPELLQIFPATLTIKNVE